jgi:glucosamine--fructose-6-phosphate aminotransferase (isomerizing)
LLQGVLRIEKISYIHAHGHASGEMKHGPSALIDEAVPVIVIAHSGPLFEKTVSNMQEVRAGGGKIVLVSDREGWTKRARAAWSRSRCPRSTR